MQTNWILIIFFVYFTESSVMQTTSDELKDKEGLNVYKGLRFIVLYHVSTFPRVKRGNVIQDYKPQTKPLMFMQ